MMASALHALQRGNEDTVIAGPFLKWAGGKGQIFDQLYPHFPAKFGKYFEPFLGSGAVFFNLRRIHGAFPTILTDRNAELINCYLAIRDQLDKLVPALEKHKRYHSERHYYSIRAQEPSSLSNVERAARFIYLNKTCYNGLYRVNKSGKFNVPIGSYTNPGVFESENLSAVSAVLQTVKLDIGDFSDVLDKAKANDFVYFDPPYYTDKAGFTSYAVCPAGTASFGADEHTRLRNVAAKLRGRGCYVIISNSDTDFVHRLYEKFERRPIQARRYINCIGAGRQLVSELVISSNEKA